jgi:FkbM family methyltransferase
MGHPLGKNKKIFAFGKFLKWQIGQKLLPYPVLYPFVENSYLLINKELKGATGNIYVGLHEFEHMAFTLHILRSNDIFCDIGANIGSYTLLASKVIGAKTYCFEPIIETFSNLKKNIYLNNISEKVIAQNIGLGDENKKLRFSSNLDTKNHVLLDENENGSYEVDVKKLDDVVFEIPLLMKIDVEGFEYFVLKGGTRILQDPALKAIIIELNNETERYHISKEKINSYLESYGFFSARYDAFSRKIKKELKDFSDNRIYIRDIEFVNQRCMEARKIKVFRQDI